MKNLKISFVITELPAYGISYKGRRKTFEFEAFDGQITCTVQYDFRRSPLALNAEIKTGDHVELILLPHRIELYINGTLADEEWPAGNRMFAYEDKIVSDLQIEISEYAENQEMIPSVISSFAEAEGWYPGGGIFVGDCMPYKKDDEYHVLYLKDRHHHRSKWGLGAHQWEHISTKDFKKWQIHPMAVSITDPTEGSICTGSWIRDGEKEYLYYTVRMCDGSPAPIRRSISTDGYHFEKDVSFGFTLPSRYNMSCARDPKVIKSEDGLYHMFITTALQKENKGCLAHFTSCDMEDWQDTGDPIYVASDSTQPECPDYFVYHGKYYLVYSLHGRAHYMVSEQAFEGFTQPNDPIIPCESVPKCAVWGDELIFTGFKGIGGYGGAMTFKRATANENGELVFCL